MSEPMSDAEMLRTVAAHYDQQDNQRGYMGRREVQADLRRIASQLETAKNVEAEGMLYDAWVEIANVSGGAWKEQSQDWQDAAARWRDTWHKHMQDEGLVTSAVPMRMNGVPDSQLIAGLELIRKHRLCVYGPDAHTCDCKFGASGKGEETGCPEVRQAIAYLSGQRDQVRVVG